MSDKAHSWIECDFVDGRWVSSLAITPAPIMIYIMGSMRNPEVPVVANKLRTLGFEVFDDWYSPGEQTDDKWQEYEKQRGRGYREALNGFHAKDVFEFDKLHLDRCDIGVLVMPAGKSAHIELGYLRGQGKHTFVLFDSEPERYDVMLRFAEEIFFSQEEMESYFKQKGWC